jgi:hypothetical protein
VPSHVPVDTGDFVPPFRGVFAAHHCLPPTHEGPSLYAQPRRHYVRGVLLYAGLVRDGRHASARPEGLDSKPLKLDPPTA